MNTWGRAISYLKLEPIFGPRTWGANSTCADVHPGGPIPEGSRNCCMYCHKSGKETHRDLKITAKDDSDLAAWVPDTPTGRDQWSDQDELVAKPAASDPEFKMSRKQRRKAKAKFNRPMDPDELARLVDSGTAKPVACR